MKVGDMVSYDRSIWLYKNMHPTRKVGVVVAIHGMGLDDEGEPIDANVIQVQWCDGSNTIEWAACLMIAATGGEDESDAQA